MSHHLISQPIWLVGSGPMAVAYAKVLGAMNLDFTVIGRGEASAANFQSKTNASVCTGGLEKFLLGNHLLPEFAIVAVGVEQLAAATQLLLDRGIRRILVEKPAGLDAAEIGALARKAAERGAEVYLGYNRRFYASTLKAQEIIAEDGGVDSFNFEFTEWGHVIESLHKAPGVKEAWFLANSTHVVDLAFYLGGKPSRMATYTSGSLAWHPQASVFSGAGISESGALFCYQANWAAPGRWGVEILTHRHRLILRPMESLQIQDIGSVEIRKCDLDDGLDQQFKPGLYRQVAEFLTPHPGPGLLPLAEHQKITEEIYAKILQPVDVSSGLVLSK